MAKRRKYDKEFKREAVRLVLEQRRAAAEVERNLGTGSNMVSRWVKEFQKDAEYSFPGQGKIKEPEQQMHDLKKELGRVKRERDILKKAVAIFSTDPDRYSDS